MALASIINRALEVNLMEAICHRDNLNRAFKRVVRNDGASGVDGMKTSELLGWLKENGQELTSSLRNGSYKPQPVRSIEIPKPSGGVRLLGIPTVIDRFVQQAMLQVLSSMIDPTFSEHSYGFRPGRGAHLALKQAQSYVEAGHGFVADLDLEKFFDKVNHDIVMSRLARHVSDKHILKIVRRFLQAGMWKHGMHEERREGTHQGGPLSPLLANILLDDLDKELEKRGHKFCRYADDCNIYVRSQAAADRVLTSISRFLKEKLKLKVNEGKSQAARVGHRTFLGYVIRGKGKMSASPESVERLKGRIRKITRRNRGREIESVIYELNQTIRGWSNYFKYDRRTSVYKDLDSWIRRRLRCYRLKQRKRAYSIAKWLMTLGVSEQGSWLIGGSSKGWWRLSKTTQLHMALSNAWFGDLGLLSLHKELIRLNA